MSGDLRDQLQRSLSAAYTIQRELGGGGMSRVFVATEVAIGRQVVLKVLPPELSASVNIERFRREIQLAGKLSHPHIVTLLSAGVADGLPYYSMPLVEGESLRARIEREGALPIEDVVHYLRGVLSALAYAHAHGVVHRDVKPDNVLLTGDLAVVTDFGVAKALRDSTEGSGALTSTGLALGTPAYMAPEQALADPNVDHRADLYATGAMTYEMLTGRPPFSERSPQALVAAQLTQPPDPLESRRADVPPALSSLVMRLLQKAPADRLQSADEAIAAVDALATTPRGAAPASTVVQRNVSTPRAIALYVGAFAAALGAAWGATTAIGLPTWVLPGVAIVMALGAPVILLSVLAHNVPAPAAGSGVPTAARLASAARPYLTWRRVALGGVASMAIFIAFVGGYMLLRSLGIGPSKSLLAAGVLKERDRVLVADFGSPVTDSTLGTVVADAIRTDLEQTRVVSVVTPDAEHAALERMRKAPGTRVDVAVARDIAQREGIKAIVVGDVASVGHGFIISARLIAAQAGDVLAAYRESAENADALIPAVDRVSRHLRAKIGESLRTVNSAPPLEHVSTSSIEALRRYTEGERAYKIDGDLQRARVSMLAAVALDSNFAMAYRKLAVIYGAMGSGWEAEANSTLDRAYDLRDRLPPMEQHLTAASYWSLAGRYDRPRAIAEYQAVLSVDPENQTAFNNLGGLYDDARDHIRAREAFERTIAIDSSPSVPYWNLAETRYELGDTAGAFDAMRMLERRSPGNQVVPGVRFELYTMMGQYDSARAQTRILEGMQSSPDAQLLAIDQAIILATIGGRLREATDAEARRAALAAQLGDSLAPVDIADARASRLSWLLDRPDSAVRVLDESAQRYELASRPPIARRYLERALEYARAGRPERARALMAEWDANTGPFARERTFSADVTRGWIALSERRPDSAIALFRRANDASCEACALAELAFAYDQAGERDSAMTIAERYFIVHDTQRIHADPLWLAYLLRRQGELYDAGGNAERALWCYGKFVALWAHADAELQPQVARVRRRMAQLAARKG
ncbi:MAG TPA: protein kinase [Gemmatimonadaceae bacterium]|nr:protein kinase [Gemmatimonadaceae bacterium]